MMQLVMDLFPAEPCEHKSCFETMACIPAGLFCADCDTLIAQNYIPPNEPEIIGYVSADWAWHYEEKNPWVTE